MVRHHAARCDHSGALTRPGAPRMAEFSLRSQLRSHSQDMKCSSRGARARAGNQVQPHRTRPDLAPAELNLAEETETEMAQPDGMGMRGVSRRHSKPSVCAPSCPGVDVDSSEGPGHGFRAVLSLRKRRRSAENTLVPPARPNMKWPFWPYGG